MHEINLTKFNKFDFASRPVRPGELGGSDTPVIKVATRRELARHWNDLRESDAGNIISVGETIECKGQAMFEKLHSIASGEKTWAV